MGPFPFAKPNCVPNVGACVYNFTVKCPLMFSTYVYVWLVFLCLYKDIHKDSAMKISYGSFNAPFGLHTYNVL